MNLNRMRLLERLGFDALEGPASPPRVPLCPSPPPRLASSVMMMEVPPARASSNDDRQRERLGNVGTWSSRREVQDSRAIGWRLRNVDAAVTLDAHLQCVCENWCDVRTREREKARISLLCITIEWQNRRRGLAMMSGRKRAFHQAPP